MNIRKMHIWLLKYGLVAYTLVLIGGTAVFFKTHYYRLHDSLQPAYIARHDISALGLSRLRGNVTSLRDPAMIGLLTVGIVLAVAVCCTVGTRRINRWPAIVMIGASLVPLAPPYTENLLPRIAVCLFLTFWCGVFQYVLNRGYQDRRVISFPY